MQVLSYDAPESFCLGIERCRADFSPGACAAYLRQTSEQHLTALRQATGILIKASRERLGA